jgi:hypothetical protein
MGATTIEVPSGHLAMVSHPDEVTAHHHGGRNPRLDTCLTGRQSGEGASLCP